MATLGWRLGSFRSSPFGIHVCESDGDRCDWLFVDVALFQSRGGFMMTSSILNPVLNDNNRSLGVKVLAADEFSVQSLMKLGLTEYEARIYVVLTKMGPRNASEISFLGKVPRPKTYGAIRGLESKGLLRIVTGKPERYMAVSPNDVLIPLVDKVSRETSECVQVVENLSVAFESSKYVYTEKPYERYDLWSVRGREKAYKRVQDMIGEAKVNVFFSTTANGLVRLYKAHSEILEKASQKVAKVHIAAPVNQTSCWTPSSMTVKQFVAGVPKIVRDGDRA